MSIEQLMAIPGAEVVCNTIQLRVSMNNYEVLARVVGQDWVITEEGERRCAAPAAPAVEEVKSKSRAKRLATHKPPEFEPLDFDA